MLNPGQHLRAKLETIIKKDPKGEDASDIRFINRVDYYLSGDGEITDAFQNSVINYVTRRLIRTAAFIFKTKKFHYSFAPQDFIKDIKRHLQKEYFFPRHEIESLALLITESVRTKNQETKQSLKDSVKQEAKFNSEYCYICGGSLLYDSGIKTEDSVEVEHIWPHALGGSNAKENLKVACHACNSAKQSRIDADDFHFELISQNEFAKLPRVDRMAIWAKNDFKCAKCNEPASTAGQLSISRLDKEDNWHYLNLTAYCSKHSREQ